MEKPFYSSKRFLNQDGYNSDASIFCNIAFYSKEDSGCDSDLKISDCNNRIHLSVGICEGGSTDFGNSMFKIDVLIDELTKFKVAIMRAKEESDKRMELKKQKEEEQKQEENENNTSNSPSSPVRSTGNTTDPSSSGMDNLQAAFYVAPNV